MALFFITGNKNKFEEVASILPNAQQLDIDLPEIQSLDPHTVITEKLKAAMNIQAGEIIVEDNSLTLIGMDGLPGTLIKWFLKSIGNVGIVKLANTFGNHAEAKVIIGYYKDNKGVEFFEGTIMGTIVEPKGDKGFGWDPIFLPEGYTKTFGEMDVSEKSQFSMRKIATEKLKDYLDSQK